MEFEKLFLESKGQPITYKDKQLKLIDRISISAEKALLRVEFVSTDSIWKQGIVLKTKGNFEVNGQLIPDKIVLWEHTAPKQVEIMVLSKDKTLVIYNVWQTKEGTIDNWRNGAAFFTEQFQNATIYHCNDVAPDEDFNDLIFKIEYL